MNPESPIILFDGVCNLCAASVRFVIARDRAARFRFASLQSIAGSELARAHDVAPGALNSVILIQDGQAYQRSSAALRIARQLDGFWPLLYVFIAVPAPLRNLVYDFIGARRYRWFGRKQSCWVPDADLNRRFLKDG